MNRRAFLWLGLALLAGCEKAEGAVEPVWGKQPCAHCAMILSERRFGAQLVTAAGDRHFFDDVGCMVLFLEPRKDRARTWVHDAESGRWLDARASRFAPAKSPMDFGFEARAEAGVSWDEMRLAVLAKQGRTP
jgi:copper chaperone NosL